MADALRELRSIAAAGSYSDGDNPLRKMVGALQEAADAYRAAAADPGIEGQTGDAIRLSAAARAHRYDSVQQVVEQLRGYLQEADNIRADAAAAVYAAPHSYVNFPDDALRRVENDFDSLAMKVEAAAAELAAHTTNAQSAARPSTGPLKLGGFTATQLTHLTDDELRDLSLRWSMDPETAAAWWASLPAATALLLARKAPWLVGALDGIPASARVSANQVIAADRAADVVEKLDRGGLGKDQRDALEAELDYLTAVDDGDVQLYLYDPANNRIIEMLGTPGPEHERGHHLLPRHVLQHPSPVLR